MTDSLAENLNWPEDLNITAFSGPDITPSPAALATSATGDLFVGMDMQGSLGKEMGKGAVLRLSDCNGDGIMDSHTEFARVDNPRGIIAVGDRVYILHTTFSEETEKASGMDLVVYRDENRDGVADGPAELLIEGISNPNYLRQRGTDHSTNGIRLGIDGWIYIAVGDFGFHDAVDRDGTRLTMLGGGILRVRPDGTEMEVYTHGLRNIYDVAIDPQMNIFTRGNTNDGGGWNVRFIDQIQSGEYGYPTLFKHFTEEILPALVDFGGGSGTGVLYLDDHRWPEAYNRMPLTADWGRSYLYRHHLTPDGGSYTQEQEPFIELPQITDLDIDGSGVMYLSAWDGAGYRGDSARGYTIRAVPEGFEHQPYEDPAYASLDELAGQLASGSQKVRIAAQQELLSRSRDDASDIAWNLASDVSLSTDIRAAGIFTYAQAAGDDGIDQLVTLTDDEEVKELALRALADRLEWADQVPIEPFMDALNDDSDRVRIAAMVGLGRLGRTEAVGALLQTELPADFGLQEPGTIGPHATPNSDIIPPHVAVQALVRIGDAGQLLDAVGEDRNELALWALRYIHSTDVAEGLIEIYSRSGPEWKRKILNNLARIYHREAPYDGSWWWGTRPDTHGPYYEAESWDGTPIIRDFLLQEWRAGQAGDEQFFTDLNMKYRLSISEFGGEEQEIVNREPEVDLEEIKNRKGQVGRASIEDVMLALAELEGDPERGRTLFTRQGCQACHSISAGEVMKGPFLGQVGGVLNADQIAESILKPNASISQGFSTVQIRTGEGNSYTGFVTEESADDLVIRDIAGRATRIDKSDIEMRRELESSMMPTGLANALSYQEFADLVTFLSEQVD